VVPAVQTVRAPIVPTPDLPAISRLGTVIGSAQVSEVHDVRGSAWAVLPFPGLGVVEVASPGGGGADRRSAGGIASEQGFA
jgi:hypothetical protein